LIGIYKILSPTNKVYIGQSSIDIENRFKYYNRLMCKGQPKLYNSLKKHEPKNHTFEIIEECLEKDLDEREIFWINHYNSVEEGLNIQEGGRGGKHNETTKTKISESLKGRDISNWKHKIYTDERNLKIGDGNRGKEVSQETRRKQSEALKGNKNMLGKFHSEETKSLMSKIRQGYKPTNEHVENMRLGMLGKNSKEIICITINKIYTSIREASKQLGISERCISNNLLGYSKTTNNLIFKYI